MACIGVHANGTQLSSMLSRILQRLGKNTAAVSPFDGSNEYDIVLIGTPPPKKAFRFTAKALVVPDCMNAGELAFSSSESVISYGMRNKNTVTVSSLIGSHLAVSLQRSIPTLTGGTVGEQEIVVTANSSEFSDDILGIIAVLLILDIPAEKISSLTF